MKKIHSCLVDIDTSKDTNASTSGETYASYKSDVEQSESHSDDDTFSEEQERKKIAEEVRKERKEKERKEKERKEKKRKEKESKEKQRKEKERKEKERKEKERKEKERKEKERMEKERKDKEKKEKERKESERKESEHVIREQEETHRIEMENTERMMGKGKGKGKVSDQMRISNEDIFIKLDKIHEDIKFLKVEMRICRRDEKMILMRLLEIGSMEQGQGTTDSSKKPLKGRHFTSMYK